MDVLERIEEDGLTVFVNYGVEEEFDWKEDYRLSNELLELAKLGKQMQWKPIDHNNMPDDGQDVDLWVRTSLGDEQRLTDARFSKGAFGIYYDEIDGFEPLSSYFTVTHWMPLPPNPKEDANNVQR